MCGAPHDANVGHLHAYEYAALVYYHEVVVVRHHLYGHKPSGLLGDAQRLHAFRAARRLAVVLHVAALSISLLAHHHDGLGLRVVHAHHAHQFVVASVEPHAAHTGRHAAHHSHFVLVEADGAAVAVGQHNLVVAVGQAHAHHLVVVNDVDGNHAVGPWAAVSLKAGLLYRSVLCGEHHIVALEELLVVELLYAEHCVDGVVGLDVEQVLYGPALRAFVAFGYLVALEPIATPLLREEEQGVVHRCRIDVFGEVGVARVGPLAANAATALLAEFRQGGALDVAQVADGYHHGVVRVEVFGVELLARVLYLRAARVAILLLDLLQLVLHHLLAQFGVVEYGLQVCDELFQLVVFLVQLVHLQARQLAQAHVDDGACLNVVEAETLHEVGYGLLRRLRRADDVYHLVDVVAGDDERLKYVGAVLCLLQVELGAAYGHVMPVVDEVAHAVLQREQPWAALHERYAVHRERALQGRHLEQLVEYHVGVGLALHVNHYSHALSSRLVVDVAYALYLLLGGQVGYVLHEVGLVHPIRYLRNDDFVVGVAALDFGLGAHHDASASCLVGVAHALYSIYVCACGEVGGQDVLHQSVGVDVGVVDVCAAAVNHLAEVVGGNVRCHAHGNSVAAVHQQVWYLRGHHRRLLQRVVEVVGHVHGVLLKVVHDVLAHFRQSALCVSHCGRRVAVDRAEVSLSVHERVSHVPVLCHAHQCSVYGAVAVRVVFSEHLAHHARAFLVRFVTGVAYAHHTVEYAAVYGLEAVAHVGQGSCHNHRHRVVDVRRLHLLLNVDFDDSVLV